MNAVASAGARRATVLDDEGDWLVIEPGAEPGSELPGAGPISAGSTSGVAIVLLPVAPDHGTGRLVREVVVDGWRFEVEVELERRAQLRERAARAAGRTAHHGGLEVRAVIPGRIVSVAVTPGDEVSTGDRLLVIEAMKMQNDVRAPRAGRIGRVAVGAGQTVELRDLLVEIE